MSSGVKTRSKLATDQEDKMAEVGEQAHFDSNVSNSPLNSSLDDNEDNNNYLDEDESDIESIKASRVKAKSNEANLHVHKGKVAGMVDSINNSPASSPVPINMSKTKPKRSYTAKPCKSRTLSSKNGVLTLDTLVNPREDMKSQESSTEDSPELLDLMRTLNATVKKLEQKLDRMEQEKQAADSKVSAIETVQTQETTRLRGLIDKLDDHDDKIEALIGIVVRQDIEIQELRKKQNTMYVHNNSNNIMIHGIPLTQDENGFHEAAHFFKTKLRIDSKIDMKAAKRIGSGDNRPLLVTLVNINDKALIFQKTENLRAVNKGRQNPYFITEQLPEEWAEKRRAIHFMKQQNKKLPDAQQLKLMVKRGQLTVDGKPFNPPLKAPSVSDIMNLSSERKNVIRQLKLLESLPEEKDDSIFVGYATQAFSLKEIENFYLHLRLAEPEATPIMCAFKLPGVDFTRQQGFLDDGEFGGGRVLMKTLQKHQACNQAVFVTRHYGGKHLGAVRFNMIEKCADQALKKLQQQIAENRRPPTQQELDEYRLHHQQELLRQQQQEQHLNQLTAPWSINNQDEVHPRTDTDEDINEHW